MHVLLADKFEQSGQDGLKAASCEVTYQPGLKDDALAQAVDRLRPDVLVVRSTKVTEAILAAGELCCFASQTKSAYRVRSPGKRTRYSKVEPSGRVLASWPNAASRWKRKVWASLFSSPLSLAANWAKSRRAFSSEVTW